MTCRPYECTIVYQCSTNDSHGLTARISATEICDIVSFDNNYASKISASKEVLRIFNLLQFNTTAMAPQFLDSLALNPDRCPDPCTTRRRFMLTALRSSTCSHAELLRCIPTWMAPLNNPGRSVNTYNTTCDAYALDRPRVQSPSRTEMPQALLYIIHVRHILRGSQQPSPWLLIRDQYAFDDQYPNSVMI